MAFKIVTDSSCNLSEEMVDEFQLEVLPLTYMVDEVQYPCFLKGGGGELSKFYDMLRNDKVITTSLPNQANTETTLRGLLDEGLDLLYVGFSSAISGTYEATERLMARLSSEYPDRKLLSVCTNAAAGGEGLLVWLTAKKAKEGASIEECFDFVQETRDSICLWFTVEDLKYLFRGGRLSKTSFVAASMLNIKPVLHVDNEGALIPMDKVRGRKKSIKALCDHMEQTAIDPASQTVFISHGDCLEDVETLKSLITQRMGVTNYVVNVLDPVIGAHAGPGTLALFFIGTQK